MNSQQTEKRFLGRSGWSREEIGLLEAALSEAAQTGSTLREIFDQIAAATHRKPNSVRNYYYTVIRNNLADDRQRIGLIRRPRTLFTPFSEQEIRLLLTTVLTAQARGESVRACTMRMGHGNRTEMLRYQNKYRSLLRTHRNLVEDMIDDLVSQGVPCYNPYTRRIRTAAEEPGIPQQTRRGRRPKGDEEILSATEEALEDLRRIHRTDIPALMRGLQALAALASAGEAAMEENERIKQRLMESEARAQAAMNRLKALTQAQGGRSFADADNSDMLMQDDEYSHAMFRQL